MQRLAELLERSVLAVDSHTEGEATRVVLRGYPDLGQGSAAQRLQVLMRQYDVWRKSVIGEPRSADAVVGALVLPSERPGVLAQLIFFNNSGYLGMCVHGLIGVARTLSAWGYLTGPSHMVETPVGDVSFQILPDGEVEVHNVLSFVTRQNLELRLPEHGTIVGDIAYGGNWFFIARECPVKIERGRTAELTSLAWAIRQDLRARGICGLKGEEIDHIELVELLASGSAPQAKNFVLCPGGEFDRSPCGTGTSAKLASMALQGQLQPGQAWVMESVTGGRFTGSYRWDADGRSIWPSIRGRAHLMAQTQLIQDGQDPYFCGFGE